MYTHNLSPNKTDTYLLTTSNIHTGVRATTLKVEHMEDRIYIRHNNCLQDMNGKTGLGHLTSLKELKALKEIKARPNFDKLPDY